MTDDKELIARLRENQSYEWQDPIWETRLAAADRIEALEAKLAKVVQKFAALEKAASDVARRGAETGPQWTKLTIALLAARATLAEIKGESHE